jgi:uncharacterized membrane protein
MDHDDRMSELERRLSRIEAALGLPPIRPPVEATMPAPTPVHHGPPPIPVELIPDPWVEFPNEVRPPVQPPRQYIHSPLPPVPAKKGNLEETIGLKWAGWVGAIVFVIGAGFLISWLYACGYFKLIPPAGRVGGLAMIGFALLAAGEYVYRKYDPRAAVGLFGAGVAVLLLVGYAGHHYYDLYGRDTAYVAMAAATAIGAIFAGRGKMVSIGVLSIIGGALAPAMLSEGPYLPAGFFAYLATLQIVALALTIRNPEPKWWTLRWVSLAITTIWVMATIRRYPFTESVAPTIFCLLSAAAYEAEIFFTSRRETPGPTGVVFNLIVTGLLTAALLTCSINDSAMIRVMWVLSVATAAAVLALACLRSHPLRFHGIGYLIQTAGLVAVLAPVALSGEWVAVAWLGWAIALASAGRWFDSPATRFVAPLVWTAAVLDLALWACRAVGRSHPQMHWIIGTESVSSATAIGLLLAVGGLVVSMLVERADEWSPVVATAALLVWVCSAGIGLSAAVSTVTIVAFAWILAGMCSLNRRRFVMTLVGAAIAVATVKWIGLDLLADRFAFAWRGDKPQDLFFRSTAEAVALSLSVAGIYVWRRRAVDDYFHPVASLVTAVAVAGIVVSFLTIDGTVEAGRWVARAIPHSHDGLAAFQWTQLLMTGVWSIGLAVFAITAQLIDPRTQGRSARVLSFCGVVAMVLALKFVLIDTGYFRLDGRPGAGPLLLNPRLVVALVLLVIGTLFELRASRYGSQIEKGFRDAELAMLMVVAVWAGTLEIDQYAVNWTADTGHVAASVFWGVCAVIAVVAGFARDRAAARYFGLALLAITVTKVVFVDMSNVQTGWRILSFMGSGGLLLLTSVLYGKVSKRRRDGTNPESPIEDVPPGGEPEAAGASRSG